MRLRTCLSLFFAALLSACSGRDLGAPEYAADACRRVALTDAETGAAIIGAEDLAFDAKRDRVVFSAYDRRAAEKAAKKKGAAPVQGGLYAVSVDDIFSGEPIEAASLLAPSEVSGGLRPHGIDYDPQTKAIAFVNRGYVRDGKKWRMEARLMRLDGEGLHDERSVRCSANDVAFSGGETYLSFDHGDCGFGAFLEDVLAMPKGGFLRVGGETIANKVRYANGVTAKENDVMVAATLERAVRVYSARSGALLHERSIVLPGAPDNLSVNEKGDIIAAIHPSLMKLALNRKMGIGKAPSRIVAVDPDTGVVRLLFDDRSGKLFSAATAAVETEAGLVMGSVTDMGLLACQRTNAE